MKIEKIKILFKKYNKEFFNNEIKNIPINLSNGKSGGYVSCKVNKLTKEYYNIKLSISKAYDFSDEQIKGVLLHEMIHAYLLQKNIKHSHDEPFLNEIKRIKDQFNFDVPLNLYKGINFKKEYSYYCFVIDRNNKKQVCFTSPKKANDVESFLNKKDYKIYYQSLITSSKLKKYKKSIKKVTFYSYSERITHDLPILKEK